MYRETLQYERVRVEEERAAESGELRHIGLYQHATAAKTDARLQQMLQAWPLEDATAACVAAKMMPEHEPRQL